MLVGWWLIFWLSICRMIFANQPQDDCHPASNICCTIAILPPQNCNFINVPPCHLCHPSVRTWYIWWMSHRIVDHKMRGSDLCHGTNVLWHIHVLNPGAVNGYTRQEESWNVLAAYHCSQTKTGIIILSALYPHVKSIHLI